MDENGFTVNVIISRYLKSLKRAEIEKPLLERRQIPKVKDIASLAGVSESIYYKWAGNRAGGIHRNLTGAAIKLLRDCGFDTTFDDILEFNERGKM